MQVRREAIEKRRVVLIDIEDEDRPPDFDDPATNEWVEKELRKGNAWAWCQVKLTVVFGPLTSEQYLGGCSYKSQPDFVNNGAYDDLVEAGISEIVRALEGLSLDHDLWEHDSTVCLWCAAAP